MGSHVSGHVVHLNISKLTQCQILDDGIKQSSMRKISFLRDVCNPGFSAIFNEVDCVVAVVNVLSLNDKLQVTVTDTSELCVNIIIWGSQLSVVNLLQPGNIVSCRNLEWRENVRSSVANLHYTDKTVITSSPKLHKHQEQMAKLKSIIDADKLFFVKAKNKFSNQRINNSGSCVNFSPSVKNSPNLSNGKSDDASSCSKSAWTSSRCDMNMKKLNLLDQEISSLEKQGEKMLVNQNLPQSPSSKVLFTPFKPPKLRETNCDRNDKSLSVLAAPFKSPKLKEPKIDTDSEEMEKYALEFVEELNI